MDFMAIFALVEKGLTVAQTLIQAEQDAEPAIKAILALVTGARVGTVTDDQLDATEKLLDALIEEFNVDLPEA